MSRHETELKARAGRFADEFLSKIPQSTSPGAVDVARDALRIGWMVGFDAAIRDVALIQCADGAVKH